MGGSTTSKPTGPDPLSAPPSLPVGLPANDTSLVREVWASLNDSRTTPPSSPRSPADASRSWLVIDTPEPPKIPSDSWVIIPTPDRDIENSQRPRADSQGTKYRHVRRSVQVVHSQPSAGFFQPDLGFTGAAMALTCEGQELLDSMRPRQAELLYQIHNSPVSRRPGRRRPSKARSLPARSLRASRELLSFDASTVRISNSDINKLIIKSSPDMSARNISQSVSDNEGNAVPTTVVESATVDNTDSPDLNSGSDIPEQEFRTSSPVNGYMDYMMDIQHETRGGDQTILPDHQGSKSLPHFGPRDQLIISVVNSDNEASGNEASGLDDDVATNGNDSGVFSHAGDVTTSSDISDLSSPNKSSVGEATSPPWVANFQEFSLDVEDINAKSFDVVASFPENNPLSLNDQEVMEYSLFPVVSEDTVVQQPETKDVTVILSEQCPPQMSSPSTNKNFDVQDSFGTPFLATQSSFRWDKGQGSSPPDVCIQTTPALHDACPTSPLKTSTPFGSTSMWTAHVDSELSFLHGSDGVFSPGVSPVGANGKVLTYPSLDGSESVQAATKLSSAPDNVEVHPKKAGNTTSINHQSILLTEESFCDKPVVLITSTSNEIDTRKAELQLDPSSMASLNDETQNCLADSVGLMKGSDISATLPPSGTVHYQNQKSHIASLNKGSCREDSPVKCYEDSVEDMDIWHDASEENNMEGLVSNVFTHDSSCVSETTTSSGSSGTPHDSDISVVSASHSLSSLNCTVPDNEKSQIVLISDDNVTKTSLQDYLSAGSKVEHTLAVGNISNNEGVSESENHHTDIYPNLCSNKVISRNLESELTVSHHDSPPVEPTLLSTGSVNGAAVVGTPITGSPLNQQVLEQTIFYAALVESAKAETSSTSRQSDEGLKDSPKDVCEGIPVPLSCSVNSDVAALENTTPNSLVQEDAIMSPSPQLQQVSGDVTAVSNQLNLTTAPTAVSHEPSSSTFEMLPDDDSNSSENLEMTNDPHSAEVENQTIADDCNVSMLPQPISTNDSLNSISDNIGNYTEIISHNDTSSECDTNSFVALLDNSADSVRMATPGLFPEHSAISSHAELAQSIKTSALHLGSLKLEESAPKDSCSMCNPENTRVILSVTADVHCQDKALGNNMLPAALGSSVVLEQSTSQEDQMCIISSNDPISEVENTSDTFTPLIPSPVSIHSQQEDGIIMNSGGCLKSQTEEIDNEFKLDQISNLGTHISDEPVHQLDILHETHVNHRTVPISQSSVDDSICQNLSFLHVDSDSDMSRYVPDCIESADKQQSQFVEISEEQSNSYPDCYGLEEASLVIVFEGSSVPCGLSGGKVTLENDNGPCLEVVQGGPMTIIPHRDTAMSVKDTSLTDFRSCGNQFNQESPNNNCLVNSTPQQIDDVFTNHLFVHIPPNASSLSNTSPNSACMSPPQLIKVSPQRLGLDETDTKDDTCCHLVDGESGRLTTSSASPAEKTTSETPGVSVGNPVDSELSPVNEGSPRVSLHGSSPAGRIRSIRVRAEQTADRSSMAVDRHPRVGTTSPPSPTLGKIRFAEGASSPLPVHVAGRQTLPSLRLISPFNGLLIDAEVLTNTPNRDPHCPSSDRKRKRQGSVSRERRLRAHVNTSPNTKTLPTSSRTPGKSPRHKPVAKPKVKWYRRAFRNRVHPQVVRL